ncbi:MAG: YdcF family protein [Labilithrix sp.]|nr:YdcF family protein [Labilithrix sp.]
MFFFLSKLLDVFLSPYTWGLLLLGAAVPWRVRMARRWRRRRALGAIGLLVLFVASALPVSDSLAYGLEHAAPSTYRDDVTYDVVVLLGGVVDERVTAESGQPSYNDNVERVVMTHRLLRAGKARYVIVSGATMDPTLAAFGEAVVLGRQLEDWGIAKDRIIIEDRAKNTRENAVYTKAIVEARGFERVLVVTSAFHMPRARGCFEAVGMKVDVHPVDYRAPSHGAGLEGWIPRAGALAHTTATLREIFGRLVYRAQGYAR